MFSPVAYVRTLCQSRGIPVSQLEKALGFSNGYLNPKKLTKLPYDRAAAIADYFGVSVSTILTGAEKNEAAPVSSPVVTEEDIKFALFGGDSDITDEMYEEVKRFAAYVKQRGKQ